MDNEPIRPSNVGEFVLSSVDRFEVLNAPNHTRAEIAFVAQLSKSLPPLSEMRKITTPEPSDTVEVYEAGLPNNQFYVKRAIPGRMTMMPEDYYDYIKKQHTRAEEYLGKYMPVTAVVKKHDESTNRDEVLIIQDIANGQSLKSLVFYGQNMDREITENMRAQIIDIIGRNQKMYKETGYRVEIDFMFDFQNDRVIFFDFDRQCRHPSDFYSDQTYTYFKNKLHIPVPEELIWLKT